MSSVDHCWMQVITGKLVAQHRHHQFLRLRLVLICTMFVINVGKTRNHSCGNGLQWFITNYIYNYVILCILMVIWGWFIMLYCYIMFIIVLLTLICTNSSRYNPRASPTKSGPLAPESLICPERCAPCTPGTGVLVTCEVSGA